MNYSIHGACFFSTTRLGSLFTLDYCDIAKKNNALLFLFYTN